MKNSDSATQYQWSSSKDFPLITEQIRFAKDNNCKMRVNVITGRQGDHWVSISPSINVSGYGRTEEEARESFGHNAIVFLEDLLGMKPRERNVYLKSFGWKQEKFHPKDFSRAYIDDHGTLQNLQIEDPAINVMQYA